jgi:CubicO group peptidase (beta-lactamase class C family)
LDDYINQYLPFKVRNPNYPDASVTFQQLLTHTSSIGDGPAYFHSYACGDPRGSMRGWLQDYFTAGDVSYDAAQNFHSWSPGARYAYSNVAYGLLGLLVENLSGMPYTEFVRLHVFAPLGMLKSRYLLKGMAPATHATPYSYEAPGASSQRYLPRPGWQAPADAQSSGVLVPQCLYSFATPPDGLARASAQELVRLLLCYVHGGELMGRRILKTETVARILSKQPLGEPTPDEKGAARVQGLTWYAQKKLGPGLIWGHTGDDPGVVTLMAFRPADQAGLVVLTNSSQGAHVAIEIANRVFGDAAQP